jgi:hypothetical protein
LALAAKFAEQRAFAAVDCFDGWATDVSEYETLNAQFLGVGGDIQRCRVTPRPMAKTDLATPSSRVREHQVDASGPGWKLHSNSGAQATVRSSAAIR